MNDVMLWVEKYRPSKISECILTDDLKTTLSLKDVEEQTKLALNETATEGYQMVDFTISGTVPLDPNVDLKLSFFASNLLDEAARNHNSFVKDQVPLPGRNVGLRFSLRF